ncbi:unnamed protein product [Lepeophtheirus salmonis]|uniref:(salmon louse) hypothetical protein n=1 Tax=Lepeophtheirus salmonis TaxID=72036 RepID=A0A7R8CI77_LEPSM|nr:unnamed protein product [Lepeophtheirus salmonis]CAF2829839.1 unnamed protein product [Lepeophtheirus salmonis]
MGQGCSCSLFFGRLNNKVKSIRLISESPKKRAFVTMFTYNNFAGMKSFMGIHDDPLIENPIRSIIVRGSMEWKIFSENGYKGKSFCLEGHLESCHESFCLGFILIETT